MNSSATCAEQAHSPVATGELCAMHICIGRPTLHWASTFLSQKCPFPWWILAHTSVPPKQHLDQFSSFCTAQPCVQHTQTDTQTMLRLTSVAIDDIYALHAGDVA